MVGWLVKHHWRIHSHRLTMQSDSRMLKNITSLWVLAISWSSRVLKRSLFTRCCRETKSRLLRKAVLGKPTTHQLEKAMKFKREGTLLPFGAGYYLGIRSG